MTSMRPRWLTGILGGGLLAVLLCAHPSPTTAQIGAGGGGRRGGSAPGLPGTDDPTDPEAQAAARRKKAEGYLTAGRELIAKGKVQRAVTKFRSVIELVGDEALGQAAFNELMSIHQEGMAALEAAEQLYGDGEYRKALQEAKRVKIVYGDVWGRIEAAKDAPNIARSAQKLIEKIDTDPQARLAIQEYEAQRRAKQLPRLEAQAKKDPSRYLDLFNRLETIVDRYPDAPTGRTCAGRLAEIRADTKVWKAIRHEKKRRFVAGVLQSVEQLTKAGLHEKAAAEYRKLTEKYPGKSPEDFVKMAKK